MTSTVTSTVVGGGNLSGALKKLQRVFESDIRQPLRRHEAAESPGRSPAKEAAAGAKARSAAPIAAPAGTKGRRVAAAKIRQSLEKKGLLFPSEVD